MPIFQQVSLQAANLQQQQLQQTQQLTLQPSQGTPIPIQVYKIFSDYSWNTLFTSVR